jgi:hypothetical protein
MVNKYETLIEKQMNITDKIINDYLQESYATIVRENRKIQFYYINDEYLWRDSRFKKTANEWNNPRFSEDREMLTCVHKHLDASAKWKKEVYANCNFEFTTTCPYCEEYIDLLDHDKGYDHDYEYTQILFGDWDSVREDVECYHCEKTFIITGVQQR